MSDEARKPFPVSWDQFHRDARALAWRLSGAGPFEAMVAVTRGGLVPAAVIARELGIRVIDTLCVSSYSHTSQVSEPTVLKGISDAVERLGGGTGKGLLVVSSDLRELMQICDRIAVMSAGRIADTFERSDWSQERILAAAFSGYVGRQDAA